MNIEAVFQIHLNMARNKNIVLINKVSPIIDLYADINMLQTVLRNLVSNAIKFTHEGGQVTVSAEKGKAWTEISVSDQGVGLSEEKIEGIFTTYRDKSTKGTSGEAGTGLGLSLCKDFVEKHGGCIHVESKPGNGCRFYFTIPIA